MLTKYERETIILYNEAEPTATVYTCSKTLMNRLERMGFQRTKQETDNGAVISAEYLIPDKKLVSIRGKRRKGVKLSEEHKRKLAEGKKHKTMV